MAKTRYEHGGHVLYDLGYDIETLCDNLKNYPDDIAEHIEHFYEGNTYVVTVTRK